MIIDSTYFKLEINIAQLGQLEVQENVNAFIKKYERKFLLNYFGLELMQEIEIENDTPTNPEIAKILNGSGAWIGLKNTDKISPIANYVFYYYAQDMISQQDGVGETWSKAENAQLTSPDSRCAYAWNEMCEMLEPLDAMMKGYPTRSGCGFSVINSFNL
jgi:hypothetical protein